MYDYCCEDENGNELFYDYLNDEWTEKPFVEGRCRECGAPCSPFSYVCDDCIADEHSDDYDDWDY